MYTQNNIITINDLFNISAGNFMHFYENLLSLEFRGVTKWGGAKRGTIPRAPNHYGAAGNRCGVTK